MRQGRGWLVFQLRRGQHLTRVKTEQLIRADLQQQAGSRTRVRRQESSDYDQRMSLPVAEVRRFNRTVVQRVGALNDRFLSRGRPMSLSRLLWEIGTEGAEVVMLRSRLGLDSGQLSRMLRALEGDGLVEVSSNEADRRVRVARLTSSGHAERAFLDARSDEFAASILRPLDQAQRTELVTAMRTVERLLLMPLTELRQVDPESPDAQRCLRAYVAELNRRAVGRGFDPSRGATAQPHEVRPPRGAFVVIYLHGEAVGCGAVKHHPGQVTDIKRMWVAEPARGLGLARRLLEHLERLARGHGSARARLETSNVLPEAIALYRSAGYAEVAPFNDEPFADRWFTKTLQADRPTHSQEADRGTPPRPVGQSQQNESHNALRVPRQSGRP